MSEQPPDHTPERIPLQIEFQRAHFEVMKSSEAAGRAIEEGGPQPVTEADFHDMVFRMLTTLQGQVIRLAEEVEELRRS